jgi:hypothetical protein
MASESGSGLNVLKMMDPDPHNMKCGSGTLLYLPRASYALNDAVIIKRVAVGKCLTSIVWMLLCF